MVDPIAILKGEHRTLESAIERFFQTVEGGPSVLELHVVVPLLLRHFKKEEPLLRYLSEAYPTFAEKIAAQHAEGAELASHLESALSGDGRDVLYLARRFRAIVLHNMIEEERDVFPLVERCLSATEREELARALGAEV